MKTLLFCTSYIKNNYLRYYGWYNYYSEIYPEFDFLILNDGPIDPKDLQIIIDNTGGRLKKENFIEFDTVLGRDWHLHWGWWRSFLTALKYGKENYDRIIHIESDAVLVSKRVQEYFRHRNEGWVALGSPKYGFPESAIQSMSKNAFPLIDTLPEEFDFNTIVEVMLPFVRERYFIGDRYGEEGKLPGYPIDYACQWEWHWAIPDEWIIK
jgi:hypothetical protein